MYCERLCQDLSGVSLSKNILFSLCLSQMTATDYHSIQRGVEILLISPSSSNQQGGPASWTTKFDKLLPKKEHQVIACRQALFDELVLTATYLLQDFIFIFPKKQRFPNVQLKNKIQIKSLIRTSLWASLWTGPSLKVWSRLGGLRNRKLVESEEVKGEWGWLESLFAGPHV